MMRAWLHIGKMTALERLILSYSDMTDEGMEPLSRLPRLEILDLRGVDVKDPGMAKLAGREESAGVEPLRRAIHG